MSHRAQVKPGDVVEVTLRFEVHSVARYERDDRYSSFMTLEYKAGEPSIDGTFPIFTYEVPEGFGRVVIIKTGEQA